MFFPLSLPLVLAQVQQEPIKILEEGQAIAASLSEQFDEIWSAVFTQQGIYTAIVNLSLIIAVVALLIFLVQWGGQLLSGSLIAYTQLVWPILVIYLLVGGGQNLANVILDVRQFVIRQEQLIAQETVLGLTLEQALKTAVLQDATGQTLLTQKARCDAIPEPEKRTQCLNDLRPKAQQFLNQVEAELGRPGLFDYLIGAFNPFSDRTFAELGVYSAANVINLVFKALFIAYQLLLEVALLINAAIAPLAVAASLLPTPFRPIITYVSGFFAVSLARYGLTLIAGLVSTVLVNAEPGFTSLGFAAFLGIFAPALSLTVGTGGGIGMLLAFSSLYTYVQAKVGAAALRNLRRSCRRR